mmetsp:Transcript_5853/g.19166  ORF Transcript_5853/g.19166 Transcript_5853/m.19166 type:complete len:299 (-) Transcript_5853:8-904(-)
MLKRPFFYIIRPSRVQRRNWQHCVDAILRFKVFNQFHDSLAIAHHVALVQNQRRRHLFHLLLRRRQTFPSRVRITRGVDDIKHHIRIRHRISHALQHQPIELVKLLLHHPGRIQQNHLIVVLAYDPQNPMPRRLRLIRHDGQLKSYQIIHQRALPRVRSAYDGDVARFMSQRVRDEQLASNVREHLHHVVLVLLPIFLAVVGVVKSFTKERVAELGFWPVLVLVLVVLARDGATTNCTRRSRHERHAQLARRKRRRMRARRERRARCVARTRLHACTRARARRGPRHRRRHACERRRQ